MGYYNYLCELLRPLRVYRLDEGSLSGAELYAAGEGLDAAAEALEKAVREGVLMTAEDEGLSRRERLFSRVGARTTPALRRLAIASLLRVGGDGFTLEAVNQTISGCGVRAVAAETDEQGVVRVTFRRWRASRRTLRASATSFWRSCRAICRWTFTSGS